jgi:hypothetical protein
MSDAMAYRTAVVSMSEERFRALLDERGILRADALAAPDLGTSYAVFAQRSHAVLDIPALKAQASRFFSAKLGLSVDKDYAEGSPSIDVAHVMLAANDGKTSGTRLCFGRPAGDADLTAADNAERVQNTYGMAVLARRCPTIWQVVRETDDDRVALTIAAIFASVLLGPILSPDQDELFGVRTARMKLERSASPYR